MSWLPSIELRGAFLALGILLGASSALAQEAPTKDMPQKGMSGGCESFKWPLDKERAAFEDAALERVASGAARGALKEQAFALALVPVADVAYTLPPAKKKKDAAGANTAACSRSLRRGRPASTR
jgi:hypothetical protein